jgi:hypothetical protein
VTAAAAAAMAGLRCWGWVHCQGETG